MARQENASYEGQGQRTSVDIKKLMKRVDELEQQVSELKNMRYMLITATNQSGVKCYVNTREGGTDLCLSYKGKFFAAITMDSVDVRNLPPNPTGYD